MFMLVSNNGLLNILLPNDNNKVLKEALKDADAKTLNNLKSGNTSVGEILRNLFEDAKTGKKANATIENMLKNSNLFKDLGSFSKSLGNLLSQVDSQKDLSKYKTQLQSFLKDISTMDEKTLKEQFSKSGVFLESKVANEGKNAILPKNLETILNQIKTILKDIPTLEAKRVEDAVSKLLQNTKALTNSGATLTQNAQNTNTQASSQTLTQTSTAQTQINQVLGELKAVVTSLQNLSTTLTDKPLQNLNQLTTALKNITTDAQLIESKNSNQVDTSNAKLNIQTQTKEILNQLKSEVLQNNNLPNKQNIVNLVDKLIQNNNLFEKNTNAIEPKALLNNLTNLPELKNISSTNSLVANLVTQLKNLGDDIVSLENKAVNLQPIVQEKAALTNSIKESLTQLKNELINVKNLDTSAINKVIDRLLNIQNLFSKIELPSELKGFTQLATSNNILNNFSSNFTSNINQLILSLKENIANSSTNPQNLNLSTTILKTVEKLESIANNINFNSQVFLDKPNSTSLQNDMKTVLLQMQEELVKNQDPKAQDTLKQVDRMLMQIDYHQLLSATSNSNNIYVPFMWEMLEEGSISMKKSENEEEKFYCEINLSLKEFGQTNLMLSLYDKNKLDLIVYASKDEFKEAIRGSLQKLKQGLNSVDLIPVNIKIADLKSDTEKNDQAAPTNVYNKDNNIGLGLDIRV